MRKGRPHIGVLWFGLAWLWVWVASESAVAESGLAPNPFFVLGNGVADQKHPTPESQAAMLAELGYQGIGPSGTGGIPEMLQALDRHGLKLVAQYVGAQLDPDKPKYDPGLPKAIEQLKGRDTLVWLYVLSRHYQRGSPEGDARAAAIVGEVAELADRAGLRVALYPHTGFYVETVGDAVRIAKQVDRKNVGVTFNLCHWLKVEGDRNLLERLEEARPYLMVVTINGADKDGTDWARLIQPLDRGSFDLVPLLRILKGLGFAGPIGLQCYGVPGDKYENLRRSMRAWRWLWARLLAESYPDHANLLVYRDAHGAEHPVQTADHWQVRREHILAGMQAAMGLLPDRASLPPLDLQVLKHEEEDDFVRQTISFVAEPGDRVPALLFVPRHREPGKRLPAMLALHPTSPLGKGVVAGLGPRPNRAYAIELAQRGYVVLAPDYPSFGDYSFDFKQSAHWSGTIKGVVNHMRAVDLLESLEVVDPGRIGVIGHSLGGHNAMFVAAFDPRLKVIVSSCGWTPSHDYYGGKIDGWTSDRYMPRLRDVYQLDPDRLPFDFYEVVAALAPQAFFSNSPLGDDNFAVEGVRKAEAKARPVFALLGAADQLQVRYPDCGHDFPPEVRREAYAFIDRALAHQPARDVPPPASAAP